MSISRDWLNLLRISNLPTCVSNVLVGCAIGFASLPPDFPGPFINPLSFLLVVAGIIFMYLGGMALNDVVDATRDRQLRPGKPIPSGRIKRGSATIVAMVLLLGGWCLCTAGTGLHGSIAAAVLLACIVLYDLLHVFTLPAVLLMGCCRGLVYVVAAFTVTTEINLEITIVLASGLGIYTAMITGIARGESGNERPPAWPQALLPIPLCLAVLLLSDMYLEKADPLQWTMIAVTILFLSCWLARIGQMLHRSPPRVVPAVLASLSGIALLDASYLAILDEPVLALLAISCFALVALMHKSISGT